MGELATSAAAGCLQGDAVGEESRITATAPTKEWEVELQEGNQMRIEVEKTDDGGGTVRGYGHRAETNEEFATTTDSDSNEAFEVLIGIAQLFGFESEDEPLTSADAPDDPTVDSEVDVRAGGGGDDDDGTAPMGLVERKRQSDEEQFRCRPD